MKNELAGDLTLAKGKSQYDTYCKRILANKVILAWILKYATEEFREMEIREAQEDSVPGEGELYYDIRFSVYYARMKRQIKLIINVEAQKDFHPGYSLMTRGIFYGARMISAQKGTEFSGMDYDNIRKVYSIWICMNAPDSVGNAISDYSICKKDKIPGIPDRKEEYDKMTVVMICLNPNSKKGNRLTKMLGVLLSPDMAAELKIRYLEREFDIPMESNMGEEMNLMCNLSDYVEELGIKKGIEQGKEQLLTQQIMKKCAKGKSTAEIADDLEVDEATVRNILEKNLVSNH